MVYLKVYNVVKDLFFTPAKNVLSFANDMFKILTFISTEIKQWIMINRRNVHFHIDFYHDFQFFSSYWFKSQTSKTYNVAKIHIAETLKSAIADQINYDVRQKYWMTLTTFILLNLNRLTQCEHFQFFDLNKFINEFKTFSSFFMIQSSIGNLYWSYWCFFIKKIVEFMFTYINHYLLLIEILIVYILSIFNCPIVFFEKQKLNGIMMSIIFHTLRLFFDEKNFEQYFKLWKFHWKPRWTRVQFQQNSSIRFL